jgi:hypothetical protein
LNLNLLLKAEPEPGPEPDLLEPVQAVQFRFRTQFEPMNQYLLFIFFKSTELKNIRLVLVVAGLVVVTRVVVVVALIWARFS